MCPLSTTLKGIRNVLAVPCIVALACVEIDDFDFYLECL